MNTIFRSATGVALLVAASLMSPSVHATPMYTVTDLGQWQPTAINDVGQIVGNLFDPSTSQSHAVLWSGGGLTPLGTSDVISSYATDINNFGQAVGFQLASQGNHIHAVKFTGSSMTDLGVFDGGTTSQAFGINNSGQVVGAANGFVSYGGSPVYMSSTAFLYSDGAMVEIGSATGDRSVPAWLGVDSFLTGNGAAKINNNGQVIGNTHLAWGGSMSSFIYEPNSSDPYTMISPLLSPSSSERLPYTRERIFSTDINDLGQVVGWTFTDGYFGAQAFLYQNGVMVDLPVAAQAATAINNNGQVVGDGYGYGENGSTGGIKSGLFLYENGNLNFWDELIPKNSGWSNLSGIDINNKGQIIGTGFYGIEQHGVLLTPVDAPSLALASGNLPVGMANTFEDAVRGKLPGSLELFRDGTFVKEAEFDRSKPTYVLVHGWNGEGSFLANDASLDKHAWVAATADALSRREPGANILAWDWTKSANSLAPDSGADLLQCFSANRSVVDCNIVPTREVSLQANYLTRSLEQLYAGSSGTPGAIKMLGHSLGAGIVANSAELLLGDHFQAPLERLTLFDAPENLTAALIGGRVKIDANVLPNILHSPNAPTIENYVAGGALTLGITGYGISYSDVANTKLLGYAHSSSFGATPMDWYYPTVLANNDPGNVGKRGLNEDTTTLQSRYDEQWGNQNSRDQYDLSKLGAVVIEYAGQYVLEKWTDLKQWGGEQIDKVVTGVQAVTAALKGKTVALWDALKDKLQGEPGSLNIMRIADSAEFVPASAGEWSAVGEAQIVAGVGLVQVTHSPSYAFTNIHIPGTADSFFVEFMPEIWGDNDTYFIAFDDQILYWLDSGFFKNDWMSSGFLDIALWADQDVLLTIGLISDEAGHKVVTGGYGFFSQERLASRSVPEPGSLALLVLGMVLLAYGRPSRRAMIRFLEGVGHGKLSLV